MIIKLTKEQCAQLQAGKPITIEPCTPKKWEPRVADSDNRVFVITTNGNIQEDKSCFVDESFVSFGTVYDTKEQAEQARDLMRSHNRLLKWLSENDDGWVANWGNKSQYKYYVYFDSHVNKYYVGNKNFTRYIGTLYMSQANAEKLCHLLNNNLIDL